MYLSDSVRLRIMPWPILLVAASLMGCGDEPSIPIDEARTRVVASAGGEELRGEELERWLMSARTRPDEAAANLILGVWIDETLYAKAVAEGATFLDSAAAQTAMQPEAERIRLSQFFADRQRNAPQPTQEQVDSLAEEGTVRVMQQILLTIQGGAAAATPAEVGKARELQRRAMQGEDFTALVLEATEDSAGRARRGYLPAVERSEMQPELATALWPLSEGQVTVVPSPAGVHVVRRATRAESLDALRVWLQQRMARDVDTRFTDSIFGARQLRIGDNASTRVRDAVREPVSAPEGGPLVTWNGGELSPEEVRSEMLALGAANRLQLYAASDSNRNVFLYDLAKRKIMREFLPDNAAAVRDQLLPAYRGALERVRQMRAATLQLAPGQAARTVLDDVFAQRSRHEELPGGLSAYLRARYPVTVDTEAVRAIAESAAGRWQPPAAPDSTAAATPSGG